MVYIIILENLEMEIKKYAFHWAKTYGKMGQRHIREKIHNQRAHMVHFSKDSWKAHKTLEDKHTPTIKH